MPQVFLAFPGFARRANRWSNNFSFWVFTIWDKTEQTS
jgi:hypothetical protein